MGPELEKLESSSASTGLETPGQQCPPNEGVWETGPITANGFSTAGVDSSKKGNISSPPMGSVDTRASEKSTSTATVLGTSSTAATPENHRLKTFNEQNKPFDPGGRREKAPPWDAAVTLLFFLGRSWETSCLFWLCPVCVCFSEIVFFRRRNLSASRETRVLDADRVAEVRNRRSSILSPNITLLKLARTSNARFDHSANALG